MEERCKFLKRGDGVQATYTIDCCLVPCVSWEACYLCEMKTPFLLLGFALATSLSAYNVPNGMSSLRDLEKAQARAKEAGKPLVLVVAIKSQPET